MADPIRATMNLDTSSAEGSLGGFVGKVGGAALGINAAMEIASKAIDAVAGAINAAAEQIDRLVGLADIQAQAERQLLVQAEITGQARQLNLEQLQEFNAALQQNTGIGDEVLLVQQKQLLAFGANAAELDKLTLAAVGLSTITGDLNTATKLLGRVLQGETSALGRYGIQVDSVEEALDIFVKTSAVAFTRTETLAGQIDRTKGNFADLEEILGSVFNESEALNEIVGELSEGILELQVFAVEHAGDFELFFSLARDAAAGVLPFIRNITVELRSAALIFDLLQDQQTFFEKTRREREARELPSPLLPAERVRAPLLEPTAVTPEEKAFLIREERLKRIQEAGERRVNVANKREADRQAKEAARRRKQAQRDADRAESDRERRETQRKRNEDRVQKERLRRQEEFAREEARLGEIVTRQKLEAEKDAENRKTVLLLGSFEERFLLLQEEGSKFQAGTQALFLGAVDVFREGVAQSIGAAIDAAFAGESAIAAIGKILGRMVSSIGDALIAMGTAAVAAGILGTLVPFLAPTTGGPVGIAAGAAAIVAGGVVRGLGALISSAAGGGGGGGAAPRGGGGGGGGGGAVAGVFGQRADLGAGALRNLEDRAARDRGGPDGLRGFGRAGGGEVSNVFNITFRGLAVASTETKLAQDVARLVDRSGRLKGR